MSNLRTAVPLGLVLILSLAACNRAPAPEDLAPPAATADEAVDAAAAAGTAPATATAPTGEFGETLLWADVLKSCGDQQVTMIHWSKEAVAQGPASIELGDINPGVFARVGSEGEKATGPWAYPGGVVVLRGDDGQARARLVFKGPENCDTP